MAILDTMYAVKVNPQMTANVEVSPFHTFFANFDGPFMEMIIGITTAKFKTTNPHDIIKGIFVFRDDDDEFDDDDEQKYSVKRQLKVNNPKLT